jgi:predicted Fe-S protein YdhL (DUF1289 family)
MSGSMETMGGATPEGGTPVPSPCTAVCVLNTSNVCVGCRRTIDEIVRWPTMSDPERRAVLDRLAALRATGPA